MGQLIPPAERRPRHRATCVLVTAFLLTASKIQVVTLYSKNKLTFSLIPTDTEVVLTVVFSFNTFRNEPGLVFVFCLDSEMKASILDASYPKRFEKASSLI